MAIWRHMHVCVAVWGHSWTGLTSILFTQDPSWCFSYWSRMLTLATLHCLAVDRFFSWFCCLYLPSYRGSVGIAYAHPFCVHAWVCVFSGNEFKWSSVFTSFTRDHLPCPVTRDFWALLPYHINCYLEVSV